ncbi:MAG TPA: hypothetical protein VKB57_24490 [Acidimicrobiales bacterium]|nr:hypothetical protein [Acidimicrobiales bacterium]
MIDTVHPRLYEAQHRPAELDGMSPRAHARLLRASLVEAARVGAHLPVAAAHTLQARRAGR